VPGLGAGLHWDELAPIARLLRCAPLAEVQELAVQEGGVDAGGLPAAVEVAWLLLGGHEAPVEGRGLTARDPEGTLSVQWSVE